MTIHLDALIEHWPGESLLYVRALPGFVAGGSDPGDLQRRAGAALQEHLDWLVEHDLIDAPSGEVELSVAEEADAVSTAIGPRFMADLAAPSEEEIETALAVGRAAISEAIDAYDETRRRGSATDPDGVLRHLADRDRWYASRLSGAAPALASGDPVDALIAAASEFEDAVDAFVLTQMPELLVRDGEEWTLAKILRRRTGHLREHIVHSLATYDGDGGS